jgi:hypothetical protein
MGRRYLVGIILAAGLVVAFRSGVVGQDAGPEATIAALQTQVADLQLQVKSLTTPTVGSGSAPSSNGATTEQVSPFVIGTAFSLIPQGDDGKVSVVAVGSYTRFDGTLTLPVMIRNNTGADVQQVSVAATARDTAGTLLASGQDRNLSPYRVPTGEVAFGYVDFDGIELPVDTEFELTVQSIPVQEVTTVGILDLEMGEVSAVDGRIVGQVRNTTDRSLSSTAARIACLSENGTLNGVLYTGLDPDRVEPGQTATFQVPLDEDQPCPQFLAASTGFAI